MISEYITFEGPLEHIISVGQRNQVSMNLCAWLGTIPH